MTENERRAEIGRLVEEYEANKKLIGCHRSKLDRIRQELSRVVDGLRRPSDMETVRRDGVVIGFNYKGTEGTPVDIENMGELIDGLTEAEAEKARLEESLRSVGLAGLVDKA